MNDQATKAIRVSLVSWTQDPIRTIYEIWQMSKYEKTLEQVRAEYESALSYFKQEARGWHVIRLAEAIEGRVALDQSRAATENRWTSERPDPLELFGNLLEMKVPVMENIDLVFQLENVPVSLREQMVRHRIGCKPGARVGADLAPVDFLMDTCPDQHDSTWWAQSMRILAMNEFANRRNFYVPPWFRKEEDREREYIQFMHTIQEQYVRWVEAGCPKEEAREIMPLGCTHSISWKLNVASLTHIIGKRGCWILQLGYWGPVIAGMVNECVEKIHPSFAKLITPPCIKNEDYRGCLYKEDNDRRIRGDDPLPPCSLFLFNETEEEEVVYSNRPYRPTTDAESLEELRTLGWTSRQFMEMRRKWGNFWRRDPDTGEAKF
jgi:Thymidylate synthase complementing protein